MPLPRGPLNEVLSGTRGCSLAPRPSNTACQPRRASARCSASRSTRRRRVVGMFDRLLSAPFPFVLTQSFTFLSKATGQGLLQRQINRMANAGDFAVSQAAQLSEALDALTSNEFVMGDHHFSLQVLAELRRGRSRFRRRAAQAAERSRRAGAQPAGRYRHDGRARGSGAGGRVLGAAAGQLSRCGRARRPSPRAISPRWRRFTIIRPVGASGNHWGDALAMFMTSARSPYHFSLHASDPTRADGGSRKDTGHTFICGPTGSGKTVFIGFLVAMLSAPRRDAGRVRQGSRTRDPGAGPGRRISAAAQRRADGSIRCSCRRRRSTMSNS